MRTRLFTALICPLALVVAAAPAHAQYGARRIHTNLATGESYHVEVAGELWNPAPDIVISSESLGIAGDQVDFVNTLGVQKTTFKQLKVVLRPGRKHKFRFEYTPITYDAQKTVDTSFKFNGQQFTVGIPITTNVTWKAYRFGYEYDVVYRDRWFIGAIGELKYTDVSATLSTTAAGLTGVEYSHARAPIPAIGAIARAYVIPNISVTGEFTAFKLPDQALNSDKYAGRFYDFDLYGTLNFTNNVGAQVGYRSFDVFYKVKLDNGTMKLKGPYFGGVVRF